MAYLDKEALISTKLYSEAIHVPDRPPHCHRKTGPFRALTYVIHSVAPKSKLASTRVSRKANSHSKVASQAPRLVTPGRKCPDRPAPASTATRSANLYQRIKRRLGSSFGRLHSQGSMVSCREQTLHPLSGIEDNSSGPEMF